MPLEYGIVKPESHIRLFVFKISKLVKFGDEMVDICSLRVLGLLSDEICLYRGANARLYKR
jgi:hypothetical protein